MTNIVPIDKSRGFTRMDNQLMEGLMAIDLPGRELKVALYIAKATINFEAGPVRIKATEVSKATNLHPDVVSRAISHLLKRRVIFRDGGARGDIGLCDPKEWTYFECPSRTNQSDSDKVVRIGSASKQTKTNDSLLYSKKEKTPITLPSEEIMPPQAEQAEESATKAERKKPFGKAQMLASNPNAIPEQLLVDWLALRKTKRAATTETVWDALNAELIKCQADHGIDVKTAMTEALSAGWQGFKAAWIAKRLAEQALATPASTTSRHHGFSDRDYTKGLTPRGDGSYAF